MVQIYESLGFLPIYHRVTCGAQTDEDPPHGFSQVFLLQPAGNSWFVANDVFRLAIHDVAATN